MENENLTNASIGELEQMFFDGKLYDELTEEEKKQYSSEEKETEE